jgi:hypothetical protein
MLFRRCKPGRLIPEDAHAIEHAWGVVYQYCSGTALCAIAYRGKRSKADWHHSFRSEERRTEAVRSFFQLLDASAAFKAKRKAERSQRHTLQVGAIVYNSWGYDQTNVDFYEVVKTTPHFVWLQPLGAETTETGLMQGRKSAIAGQRFGETTKHQVSDFGGAHSIHFKHGSGSVWDGKPKFCSWYA